MSSSIPYNHPSLVLGNIIDTRVIDVLKQVSGFQGKTDSAQDKLNSFIMMKRSLAMTLNELRDMNVDISSLQARLLTLDESITQSASDYLSVKIENETQIQQLREQLASLDIIDNLESPIDFSLSKICRLPLASESIKLDAQYFSFTSDKTDNTIASIERYIAESTSNIGAKSDDIAKVATAQVSQQVQNHNVSGTLIITASCTHSNVSVFDPLVLDPDKAISAWNHVFSSNDELIDTEKLAATGLNNDALSPINSTVNCLSLISGASFGSSFVGMVHLLRSDTTTNNPSDSLIVQLKEKLTIGGWLENASGGFGVDASVLNNVKSLLNMQSISSHVSMIVMGALPSIASNQLKFGINKMTELDSDKTSNLIEMSSSDSEEKMSTPNSEAELARKRARIINAQGETNQNLIQGLGKMDREMNNILDINSMMVAFENYLTAIKSKDESVGVPINFYQKKLTKAQIEELWIEKYYPTKAVLSSDQKPTDTGK